MIVTEVIKANNEIGKKVKWIKTEKIYSYLDTWWSFISSKLLVGHFKIVYIFRENDKVLFDRRKGMETERLS